MVDNESKRIHTKPLDTSVSKNIRSHHSIAYQKQGRVKMKIGSEIFSIEEGDTYFHPLGIIHQHEAIEDSLRIETKIFPNGGAIASWNSLVGLN